MCGSTVDMQSPTAEIRRGKKIEDRKKPQGKNIMACPITYGGHKKLVLPHQYVFLVEILDPGDTLTFYRRLLLWSRRRKFHASVTETARTTLR